MLQDLEVRKLKRARNVVFDESKVIIEYETKDIEGDFFFDVSFDQEKLEYDNQNIAPAEIKEDLPFKPLVKIENFNSDESSSIGEIDYQEVAETRDKREVTSQHQPRDISVNRTEYRTIEKRSSQLRASRIPTNFHAYFVQAFANQEQKIWSRG